MGIETYRSVSPRAVKISDFTSFKENEKFFMENIGDEYIRRDSRSSFSTNQMHNFRNWKNF